MNFQFINNSRYLTRKKEKKVKKPCSMPSGGFIRNAESKAIIRSDESCSIT
jgi:hypothetical protein